MFRLNVKMNRLFVIILVLVLLGLPIFALFCNSTTSAPSLATIDLSDSVNSNGVLQQDIQYSTPDGMLKFHVANGTTVLTKDGEPLQSIEVQVITDIVPPDTGAHLIRPVYNCSPDGATFDPGITATITYDPALINDGILEERLLIAYYNPTTGQWVSLPSTSDTLNHAVVAGITHFTKFALYSPAPSNMVTPSPVNTPSPSPSNITSPTVPPTQSPTVTASPSPSPTPEPEPTATPFTGGGFAPPPAPATPTPCPVCPTATPTPTPTPIPTSSPTPTPTPTQVYIPPPIIPTPTLTPTPTPTATPEPTPTATPEPTPTPTPEPTSTPTPEHTPTPTPEPTPTQTPEPTPTPTPEPTPTPTPEATPTPTPTACPCVSDFYAAPTAFDGPGFVSFYDSSTGPVIGWEWDLNGDSIVDAIGQNPKYYYSTNGYYTITLTIYCDSGSQHTLTKPDYIYVYGCGG